MNQSKNIKSLLIANLVEVAIRIMRAATKMGLRSVGVFSNEDRFALHRFEADGVYMVGAVITHYYDSLLVKVTAWGVTADAVPTKALLI